jgi:succinate dehydrogenase / fumarate reductase, cytochrome b subunit
MAARPLSPHLFIYRFAYTMALSILHRATGLALSFGILLLVAWLLALASGPEAYARYTAFAGSWPVRVVVALGIWAFCFHFANGIRHLFWDMGLGLERPQARRSARLVVVVTVVAALFFLYAFFFRGSAA